MLGRRLAGYVVERKLAEGGMGEVYAARHELMQREAVVKVLHRELSVDAAIVRRFFNEARAAASVHHPGIVEIYDLGEADGQAYIVMEMLRGEVLSARIARQRLPALGALHLVRQLAGALGAAHALGIVHRDLKPDNVFVVPDPEVSGGERVKVLDFGIAKLAQGRGSIATRAGSVFGTPAYMAPEQCSDAATVDHRADLYAVGCILFELLCGRPPFGHGGLELLAAHLRDPPPAPSLFEPSVPPAVDEVVLRLLAKAPAARPQTCAEVVAAIEDATRRLSASGAAAHPDTAGAYPGAAAAHVDTATAYPGAAVARVDTAAAYAGAAAAYPGAGFTAAPASPPPAITTRGASAGQSLAAPTARPRSALWLGGAAALALMAAAGLYAVGRDGGPGATAASEIDAAPVADPRIDEHLQAAEAALAERRWEDALVAGGLLAAVAPEHPGAAAVQQTARDEMRHQIAFERLEAAARADDARGVAAAWADIAETSAYRALARADYERARDGFVEGATARARSAARRSRCDQIGAITEEVGAVFPDARAALDELATACRDRRPARASASPPPPDAAPPARPAAVGELTRAQIASVMRRLQGRVAECGARHAEVGTVTIRVAIAPSGDVASAQATSAPSPAVGACVAAVVRTARFPASSAGGMTSASYPFVLR